MTDHTRATSVTGHTSGRIGPTVVALWGVQFVDVLGVTVVITALPTMLADVGATKHEGTAVVTAYAVFFGGLLMVGARLGDRIGHRRAVLASLVVFAAASAVGARAGTVWALAISRAVQGAAAAASVPAALRLLTTVVPHGRARRRAVAGWSAAGAAAGAAGFAVGGLLTDAASWRAVFWGNIGLAFLLTVAILCLVPADRDKTPEDRIGWLPAVLLTGASMAVVAGCTLLGTAAPRGLSWLVTAGGLLAAAAFVVVERRAEHPLVAPSARRSPRLRWGAYGSFANTATTSSSITLAAIHLQDELGLPPLRAAAVLVTFSVLVVAGAMWGPRLATSVGSGPAVAGALTVIAVGNTILVAWPTVVAVAMAAGVAGFGIGIGSVAATDMGTAVDERLRATAAGVLNTAAQFGTAIGTALVLLVATTFGARMAWGVVAGLSIAAAAAVGRWAPRVRDARSRTMS